MIQYIGLGILLILSLWDILEKKVPIWMLFLFSLVSAVGLWQKDGLERIYALFIIVIAIVLWVLLRKKEAVGSADLWTIAACGSLFSVTTFHMGVMVAGLLGGIAGAIIFWWKRERNGTLPFLPFLLIGMVIGRVFVGVYEG